MVMSNVCALEFRVVLDENFNAFVQDFVMNFLGNA